MTRTVRARVTRGMLAPLESLELAEGSVVDVTVTTTPSEADITAFRSAAGGWRGRVDAERLIRNIYEDRLVQTRPVPLL